MNYKTKTCVSCGEQKIIWKTVGKRDRYCRDCWYKQEKPKPISPISDKMRKTMDEYGKKRIAFLAMFNLCQANIIGCCSGEATDVHHKQGRGDNHNTISTWLAVCRPCHTWIETHPQEAKDLGFSDNRLH
jgi:hypothetical protein